MEPNTPEPTNTPPVAPESAPQESVPPIETPAPESVDNKPSFGPVVGIIIVVVILAVGGLYIWGGELSKPRDNNPVTAEDIMAEKDTVTQNLQSQSVSDEVGAIENDLVIPELDDLDADLANIDAELDL